MLPVCFLLYLLVLHTASKLNRFLGGFRIRGFVVVAFLMNGAHDGFPPLFWTSSVYQIFLISWCSELIRFLPPYFNSSVLVFAALLTSSMLSRSFMFYSSPVKLSLGTSGASYASLFVFRSYSKSSFQRKRIHLCLI